MGRRRFANVFQVFFTLEALVPFLFGSVSLGVLSNAVYSLLTDLLGTNRWVFMGIIVGVLAIFCLSVWLFAMVVRRLESRPVSAHTRAPDKHTGLILLVSREEPCDKAIAYHRPVLEQVWLLCSSQTLSIAQKIQKDHTDLRVDPPLVINDLNNPLEMKHFIEDIYPNLPSDWGESDVIADYTGMTAHCSVGVALACLSPARHLQYTPAIFDKDRNPMGSGEPMEVRLDWGMTGLAPKPAGQWEKPVAC